MLTVRVRHRHTPLLMLGALAAVAFAPGVSRGQDAEARAETVPRPRSPYVVAACPGECCHYGTWRFVTPAEVRGEPHRAATVVARIGAGHRVRADSGLVRIDTIGLAVVRRDFRDADAGHAYRGGDTLLVLDYLGEGFSNVWVHGERRQLSLLEMRLKGAPVTQPDTATLVELRPAAQEWWAHVTLAPRRAGRRPGSGAPRAREGWVNMTGDVHVNGADSCGGAG